MTHMNKLRLIALMEAFIIAMIIALPAIWYFWDMTP